MKPKIIILIATAVILVVIGYLVYRNYYYENPPDRSQNSSAAVQNSAPKSTEKPEVPATKQVSGNAAIILPGFKLYKNTDFGFEIQYPKAWAAVEEDIENVRGENTKAFYFKKPNSDLRFAILPRDGLSYGLPNNGTTTDVMIGGSAGSQTQFTLADGRRLWLLHPNYGLYNWSQDIGRIDILSSATDPVGDTRVFEKMLNSFKFKK